MQGPWTDEQGDIGQFTNASTVPKLLISSSLSEFAGRPPAVDVRSASSPLEAIAGKAVARKSKTSVVARLKIVQESTRTLLRGIPKLIRGQKLRKGVAQSPPSWRMEDQPAKSGCDVAAAVIPDVADGPRIAEQKTTPKKKQRPAMLQEPSEDYTWLFAFPLPAAATPQQQKQFDRALRVEGATAVDILVSAFGTFATEAAIGEAMNMEIPYRATHSNGSSKLFDRLSTPFSEPLLSRSITPDGGSLPDSFSRAQQCTIELFLAFLDLVLTKTVSDHTTTDSAVTTYAFNSDSKDVLYVCVHVNHEVAEMLADIDEYPVQLSTEGVEKLGIELSDPSSTRAYVKYDAIFRDLCATHADLYSPDCQTVIRHIDRIRVFYDKITDFIDLSMLQGVGLITDSFPLHHYDTVLLLKRRWGTMHLIFSLEQPLDEVRTYFGEEIAFYFCFLHELTRATAVLAVLTVGWSIFMLNNSELARPTFSVVLIVWYRVFTKHWQQTQKFFANHWGLYAHSVSTIKELQNSRFRGQLRPAPENERQFRLQVTKSLKNFGRLASVIVTGAFIAILLGMLVLEHIVIFKFYQTYQASWLASILSMGFGSFCGVQIKVVDTIWDKVSAWVTDLEFRHFEASFLESKRIKASLVKFITSTSTTLFFAFVQPALVRFTCNFFTDPNSPCVQHDRDQLKNQLLSMFVTRYILLASSINDVIKPFIRMKSRQSSKSTMLSYIEFQTCMSEYSSTDLNNDWLDILLPLGFTIFFGMMSPSCVLLLLFTLLIQVRTDAWKLLTFYKRPYPHLVNDIGVFGTMLSFFGYFMICTNFGLLSVEFGGVYEIAPKIANSLLGDPTPREKLLVGVLAFLSVIVAFAAVWRFIDFVIPDETQFLRLERRRQDLQRHHLFYMDASAADSNTSSRQFRRLSIKPDMFTEKRANFSNISPSHKLTRRAFSDQVSMFV